MERVGESGVQLSICVEIVIKQQLQINSFTTSLWRSQAGHPAMANIVW